LNIVAAIEADGFATLTAAELLPGGLAWWDEAGPMAKRRGGSQSP